MESTPPRRRSRRALLFWIAALVLLAVLVLPDVLDPCRGREYVPISHGNHVHYKSCDADPDADINQFPTTPPRPDEKMLPNGQVVPR